ncbi:MAG: hypothetical protein R3C11_16225 [Planctomycetaceae bacterium]
MMIESKLVPAIQAIHTLIIYARMISGDSEQQNLPKLLDEMDHLVNLMLSESDETDSFESALKEIADQFTYCNKALDEFNQK